MEKRPGPDIGLFYRKSDIRTWPPNVNMSSQQHVSLFLEKNDLACPAQFRALDLVSEVGEVAKEILKMTNYGTREPEPRAEIKNEIGDVYFSLLVLAESLHIDLEEALRLTLEKYDKRLQKGSAGSEVD